MLLRWNPLKYALAALAFLLLGWHAQAAPQDFIGTWINTNPNTTGVLRINVDNNLNITVYYVCTPAPCEVNQGRLDTYGRNNRDPNHRLASTTKDFSFKREFLYLRLRSQNRIAFDDFNYYLDGSNRYDYIRSETLRRRQPDEPSEFFESQPGEPQQ